MSLGESVWDRLGEGRLSKRTFAFLVCFWTLVGLGASAAMAAYTMSIHWQPSIWSILGLGLVLPLVGVFVALRNDNPVLSLLGYAMIAVPFGAITGPIVALYTTASLVKVLLVTGLMTGGLGLTGAIFPGSLEHWGGWLFGALLLLILGMFVTDIAAVFGLPVQGALTLIDWAAVVIFGLYIIFDMNRAMRVERTHDNAIDCAVALYLDAYNLFLHLLRIMGKVKD